MSRTREILEEELGPVEAAERIAELEDALRDADKYFEGLQMGFGREPTLITQWRERARELLEKPNE